MKKNRDKNEFVEIKVAPKKVRRFLTKLVKGTAAIGIGGLIGYGIAKSGQSDSNR